MDSEWRSEWRQFITLRINSSVLHIRENAFNGMERLVLCSGGWESLLLKKLRHQIFLRKCKRNLNCFR